MVEFKQLSKIGFGSYRVSVKNKEHFKALTIAIKNGCNLIDTAPNYYNGEAEQLIGKVLSEQKSKDVFIISKAGYAQYSDLERSNSLKSRGTFNIKENFWFSLSPEFLSFQINNSLKRLGRKSLDGFLIHNPEYILNLNEFAKDKDKLYTIILEAFHFLEEKVRDRTIRYYGISSNTLPLAATANRTISLPRIFSSLNSSISDNHFKILQFPYNAIEQEAVSNAHANDKSLVALAKEFDLISLCNRPLNAGTIGSVIRLATYQEEYKNLNHEKSDLFFSKFFDAIILKLRDHGMESQWREFPILVLLKENWKGFGNPEAVHKIFDEHLLPFLDSLFENSPPEDFHALVENIRACAVMFSKIKMTEEALKIESSFVEKGIIKKGNTSLSCRLIDYYLSQGIDHVLIGMRKEKYVTDFIDGFGSR